MAQIEDSVGKDIYDKNLLHHKLSYTQKMSHNKAYYRHNMDLLVSGINSSNLTSIGLVDDYENIQENYNLVNGLIDKDRYNYVHSVYKDIGELPADFKHIDILSADFKRILSKELKRPFNWRIKATNGEAVTAKEEERYNRIKQFVTMSALAPLQNKNVDVNDIEKVHRFMDNKFQLEQEKAMNQLLNIVVKDTDLNRKFNEGWFDFLVSGRVFSWIGERNGLPDVSNINVFRFKANRSTLSPFISDGQDAIAHYKMTIADVIGNYGEFLSETEQNQLMQEAHYRSSPIHSIDAIDERVLWHNFTEHNESVHLIDVFHAAWIGYTKIGFLRYYDLNTNDIEETVVSEDYNLNKDIGDIDIEWQWIPEVQHCVRIGNSIYPIAEGLPEQTYNNDGRFSVKLPFCGIFCDDRNSIPTSLIDRVKSISALYDIVMYRIERLMASDKGKVLLANIGVVPDSQGIDINKFMYYAEANNITFINPNEEGSKDVSNRISDNVHNVDMSLASDISKYINFAEYLESKFAKTIGINESFQGNIKERSAARNVNASLESTNDALAPYLYQFWLYKRNVLEQLLHVTKKIYSRSNKERLSYVLGDSTIGLLNIDKETLRSSYYGLFVEDAGRDEMAYKTIMEYSHAAAQNDKLEMSDLFKVLRTDDTSEVQTILEEAKEASFIREQELIDRKKQADLELLKFKEQAEIAKHDREKELVILKEKERRKTEIAKAAVVGSGFADDKDANNNNIPDIIENAKMFLENKKLELDNYNKAKDREIKLKEINSKNKNNK